MRKRKDFNWVGHWFTLAEQTGERSEIIFGEVRSDHTRLSRLSQIDYDGITGLIHLLRERGELHADFLPCLPVRSKPSVWVQLREALKIVFKGPVKARKWAVRNPAWREGVSSSETVAFSWHVLSAQDTSMVIATSPLRSVWIMPVSIHPEISVDTAPQNRSSYVDVYIPPKATPQEIEREVRRLEKKRAFWGVWLLMNVGRWLGEWVVKLMVKTNPKTQQKTGVFSNLGNWTGPSQVTSPSASAWFFMPPMVAFQPFAASALTWNGCLTLGVRLHPVLSTDHVFSQQLVERWRISLPRSTEDPAVVDAVVRDAQERRDVRV